MLLDNQVLVDLLRRLGEQDAEAPAANASSGIADTLAASEGKGAWSTTTNGSLSSLANWPSTWRTG